MGRLESKLWEREMTGGCRVIQTSPVYGIWADGEWDGDEVYSLAFAHHHRAVDENM